MKKILTIITLLISLNVYSQNDRDIDFKFYGHLQSEYNRHDQKNNTTFNLGEQDFFVNADISERVSFLGETIIKFDGATTTKFSPSIERAQIKYNYFRNHSVMIKIF